MFRGGKSSVFGKVKPDGVLWLVLNHSECTVFPGIACLPGFFRACLKDKAED